MRLHTLRQFLRLGNALAFLLAGASLANAQWTSPPARATGGQVSVFIPDYGIGTGSLEYLCLRGCLTSKQETN